MKWPVAWQKWDFWKFSNTVWLGNLGLVLLCLLLQMIIIDSPSRSCILFSGYPSIYPSIHPSIYLSIYLSIHLSFDLSICLYSSCYLCSGSSTYWIGSIIFLRLLGWGNSALAACVLLVVGRTWGSGDLPSCMMDSLKHGCTLTIKRTPLYITHLVTSNCLDSYHRVCHF